MDTRPPLLYLVHRIPFPPNKGDKVRSFNILRHLAKTHRVFLGAFIDQGADRVHAERLREWCEDVHVCEIRPRVWRFASLIGLLSGEALSLPYYRDAGLRDWVQTTIRTHQIRRAVAFSGPMAQYLEGLALHRRVVDFCDVDSEKWLAYALRHRWPLSWLYRREGRLLRRFERRIATLADASTFVSEPEAELFTRVAPECSGRLAAIPNGVDAAYFSPAHDGPLPAERRGPTLVFSGAMDYWPNVDAVCWFVQQVLPRLRTRHPDVCLWVVGMNPTPEVRVLAGPGVVVTGAVTDVRPWIAHADLAVAPLRIARGIQNKVLEAMAMGRPVVATHEAAEGISAEPGREIVIAADADDFAAQVGALLDDSAARERMGWAARARVLADFAWESHLAAFDALLAAPSARDPRERSPHALCEELLEGADPRALVVHVVYRFQVGGLENGVVNLINRLPAHRYRHVVVALTDCVPEFCRRVLPEDVRFVSLHKPEGHGVKLYPALFRLLRGLRPAIVHTRNLAALEVQVPAWLAGVPVRVHGEHGWDVSDPHGQSRRYKLMRRLYRPFVTHYIALSGHLASYLKASVGVPGVRVERICNGVDIGRFRPGAAGREFLPDCPFREPDLCVIGTVGRLQQIKDPLNLLRAFVQLVARDVALAARARLMIVGDGPLRGELAAEIANAGVADKVWLVGERADVPAAMRAMDVFVLPSRAEGISNTILEAMACGLPVIATRVGGNPELVVEGETGSLIPASDSGALADAMARYVEAPEFARRQGRAGRLRAEREFSLDGMVARYGALYDALLGEAGQTVPVS